MPSLKSDKATVLILTIWGLSFLSLFAVNLGSAVQQRIKFVSHIEQRAQLRLIAEAGIKKTIALLRVSQQETSSSNRKWMMHNNPSQLEDISLAEGKFSVLYQIPSSMSFEKSMRYGVIDEAGKINLNTASREELNRLLQYTLSLDQDRAQRLAESVIDWREWGEKHLTGLSAEDASPPLSVEEKNAYYEILEELLLVEGMNASYFKQLRDYVTVYGDGRVNINTAPKPVLWSLGLDDSVAEKILSVRRGHDQEEATPDDFVFSQPYDIVSDLNKFFSLKPPEIKQIEQLNFQGRIKTDSSIYMIESQAQLASSHRSHAQTAVFDLSQNSIIFWREK